MRYQVNRGIVKHKGAFLRKGSFFDADEQDVQNLISDGRISLLDKGGGPAIEVAPTDDTTNQVDASATEALTIRAEDTGLPDLNADDLIVEPEHPKRGRGKQQ